MTAPADRRQALEILDAAVAAGARAHKVAELMEVGLTSLQRWRRQFAAVGDGLVRRKGSQNLVSHRLSDEERQRILLTCNDRVLHAHSQVHRRGRAHPSQQPRPVPRLEARGPNEVWSWDITYLPTSVRGVWLYLYLAIW